MKQDRGFGAHLAQAGLASVALALFLWPLPVQATALHVSVNGVALDVPGPGATIAQAAERAGIPLRTGLMRSVATGMPLPQDARPPRLRRNGVAVGPTSIVKTGDRLRIVNGEDFGEPTDDIVEAIAAPSFPDLETQIWHPGKPGQVARRVGRYSGEKADDHVIEAPVPPTADVGPLVVFSFDDGPDRRWTPAVLDILKAKGVTAVFCLVGVQIDQFPDLVKRIHDEGHILCDHTVHHDMYMSTKPDAYVGPEIQHPYDQIKSITGEPPRFYRGPGGDLSPFIIGEAHRLGMRVLGWSVDPADYRRPGAETIQNRVALNLHSGGVALMHDGGGDRSQTVAQLPGLIDRVRAEGYTIVVP